MGSVTPLLAVWQEIKIKTEVDALWVGTRQGPERRLVESYGIDFKVIVSAKLRRNLDARNFFIPFFLFAGYLQSFFVLLKFKPNLVVSSGGFVSVPLVWVAWILGIRVYLHQEDLKIGLANLLMAPFARAVTTAFPETAKRFPHPSVRYIGNPVREEILKVEKISKTDAWARFGFISEKPVLLVLGGGTGAESVNRAIFAHKKELLKKFQILHVGGVGKSVPEEENGYLGVEFLNRENLPYAYRAADMVLSRAGMGVISELAAVGLGSVLVPIPKSSQEANAQYLCKRGAAIIIEQKELFTDKLKSILTELADDQDKLEKLKSNLRDIFPVDAGKILAEFWFSGSNGL